MRRFTNLYLDLDATNATSEKLDLLESYFRAAPPEDAAWALALFTGARPKRGTSSRALTDLAVERAGMPPWLVSECYAAVGDLSEAIALLLPGGEGGSGEPLHRTVEQRVIPLTTAADAERRAIIAKAWDDFDADQRFIFHKLIRGGFRIGVQARSIARVLARIAGVDTAVMAMRLAGGVEPTARAFRALLNPAGADDTQRPYPFYLAHQLNDPPHTLGDPAEWHAEWKWDGIRAQLIHRVRVIADPPSGVAGPITNKSAPATALWSRGEEVITHQFPEIIAAAAGLPRPCVLDGEVLLLEAGAPHRPLPFAELQTRLNRKAAPTPQLGLFDARRIAYLAFDLLELDGQDLRERTFAERRAALGELLLPLGPDAPIRVSESVEADAWEELARLRETSRERNVEGLVLKHRASPYRVGRTKPSEHGAHAWWKWKIDPFTVDAVLTYAQPGSGRRASLLTDYTFGVWTRDPAEGGAELITFAKAYSGLNNDEIERLDRWARRHTRRTMGPVREVEPVHVFEIAFEDIRPSKRHRSGIAVRFPRVLRWRTDKPPEEADTLDRLIELAASRHRG